MLDIAADQFGVCKHCGFLKKDHRAPTTVWADPYCRVECERIWSQVAQAIHAAMLQPLTAACESLDMEAKRLGDRENCGLPKKDHERMVRSVKFHHAPTF